MIEARVIEDSEGQLVLPFSADVLNQMGWEVGDELLWEIVDDNNSMPVAYVKKKK